MLKKTIFALCISATTLATLAFADEEREAIPQLDHVFMIVMENHTATEILGNTRAPFINQYAHAANQATRYFAVGHPSLPNYLHIVGGSNFGVAGDPNPKWHDDPASPGTVVPLVGAGVDLATPAALTGATGGQDIPAAPYIARTIADQLHDVGKSWKSYQESLPTSGADRVDASDGIFSNLNTEINQVDLAKLYAVKHNPFAYFESVQDGEHGHSLRNVVGFDGVNGLYADLRSGHVPNLSLIVPNQCRDMHGLSNAGNLCANDATLIEMGDVTVRTLVGAIKASPAWREGKNAIVVVWDENDFSNSPNLVVMIGDTNYGAHGVQSATPYNHHSLLKTLEAGFGVDCLNHACDPGVHVMSDLFGRAARR